MLLHLLCILSCHHFNCTVTPKDGWCVSTSPLRTKQRLTEVKAGLQCHDLSPLLYHHITKCRFQISGSKHLNARQRDSKWLSWKKPNLRKMCMEFTWRAGPMSHLLIWRRRDLWSSLHCSQPPGEDQECLQLFFGQNVTSVHRNASQSVRL